MALKIIRLYKMKFFICILFTVVSIPSLAQTKAKLRRVRVVNILSNNEIISLTNPRPISDSEMHANENLVGIRDLRFYNKKYSARDSIAFSFPDYILEEGSFRLTLNNKKPVSFIATIFGYYIKLNDSLWYELPDPEFFDTFQDFRAVSFKDLNEDGYTDIIVLGEFIRGYGPNMYDPEYLYKIYFGSKDGFYIERYSGGDDFDISNGKPINIGDIKKAYKAYYGKQ
jgi:hypothetical protein